MNTDALEFALLKAERRVLEMQTKLHCWATDDRDRRFDDLFNLVADPAFLLVAWVRCEGTRALARPEWTGQTARSVEDGQGVEVFLNELPSDLKDRSFRPLPCGNGDPQAGDGQAPSAGDSHRAGPGGPGVPEAGAGADL